MENPRTTPTFGQAPKEKRIEFLKDLMALQDHEQHENDDWRRPLSDEEVSQMREIITADYFRWVTALGLTPVPLDVYGCCGTSIATTQHGTSLSNGTPGYGKPQNATSCDARIIVMPLTPALTREEGTVIPGFPPDSWKEELPIWPGWRTNLLHELVHQLEDQILHIWSGKENPHTYYKALEEAAARLNPVRTVTLDELRMLTWPQIVEQMKLSSQSNDCSKV